MIMKKIFTALSALLLAGQGFFAEANENNDSTAVPQMMKSVTTTTVTTTVETVYLPVDTIPVATDDRPRSGGRLMWVPDSLTPEVKVLLKGHSRVVDDPLRLDVNEKVIVKGDTLPMVLKDRNLGRYDRGLFNFLYIPKGSWNFGLTASYGEFSTSDLEIFDLLSDVDINAHSFNIKPYLTYFIKNNIGVGVRMAYTRTVGNIDSFKLDIDEDMSFNLHDISYRSESYSAAVFMQQYMGLTRRGRFGIYNEVELSFSSGSNDFNRPFNGELRRTHSTTMKAALTFSPGVRVFIMENVSFHVSFGVFGFQLGNEKQSVNDVEEGNRFTSGANFKINLFNLAFGIGIHL